MTDQNALPALIEVAATSAVAVPPARPEDHAMLATYTEKFVAPVRRLKATLSDVLDIDHHPDRSPEEALRLLKAAMEAFNAETADWT